MVLVLLSAINLAQQSIRIATPYFVPDEQLVTALQLAALRGVDVQLVLPAANNHRLVAWAAGRMSGPCCNPVAISGALRRHSTIRS